MNKKTAPKTAMRLGIPSGVMFHALRFHRILRDSMGYLSCRATARKTLSTVIDRQQAYRF